MSRVFLMRWYHFTVEYFEDLRNVNHCEFLIMRKKEDSGKYILENNLRTWSELKRERVAAAKEKEKGNSQVATSTANDKDKEKEKKLEASVSKDAPRKKWGGCPNGCDHGKHNYRKENSMHAMQLNGRQSSYTSPIVVQPENLPFRRQNSTRRWQNSSEEEGDDDPRARVSGPQFLDVQRSRDEMVSSPDGTPSFISVEDRLRNRLQSPKHLLVTAGRDFGGSQSGNTSQIGSDTEYSQEEDIRKRMAKGIGAGLMKNGVFRKSREMNGMGRHSMADALGDQSDVGSDAGSEFEEISKVDELPKVAEVPLPKGEQIPKTAQAGQVAEETAMKEVEAAEKEDRSIKGSVY